MGEYNKKIDGFTIKRVQKELKKESTEAKVVITFFSNHEVFISKTYQDMPEDKIKKIYNKLLDYTLYNLNEPLLSRCITFLTILYEIERIIFPKE